MKTKNNRILYSSVEHNTIFHRILRARIVPPNSPCARAPASRHDPWRVRAPAGHQISWRVWRVCPFRARQRLSWLWPAAGGVTAAVTVGLSDRARRAARGVCCAACGARTNHFFFSGISRLFSELIPLFSVLEKTALFFRTPTTFFSEIFRFLAYSTVRTPLRKLGSTPQSSTPPQKIIFYARAGSRSACTDNNEFQEIRL
jgi:hypothetical protein